MKRIEWIDSLKGFGIFCVTLGHLSCNYLIETHIYSFHMFLFFFLSGFLHKNAHGDFKKYIAKKIKSLFIPFLSWNFLSCLFGVFIGKNISDSIRLFFLLDGEICWNAPIWFLLQLFLVEIVFFYIEKYIPHRIYLSIPILILLWMLVSGNNIFLKLNILPICLLFYILGYLFKQFYGKFNSRIIAKYKYAFGAAVLFLCTNILFGVILNKRISFTGADFGNVFFCGLAAVSGVLFYITIFHIFHFLRANKVLVSLGKNSLIIMATQYWFFKLYDAVSHRLFGISIWHYRNSLKALAISVITIMFICIIVDFLKKISVKSICIKMVCTWFGLNIP